MDVRGPIAREDGYKAKWYRINKVMYQKQKLF